MIESEKLIPENIRNILRKHPKGLTITELSTHININRNSTARYLDVLQILGQVEMRKVGPAKLYSLSQRVPVGAMLNLTQDGILIYDSALEVIRVNDNFSRMVGVKRDDLLGAKLDHLSLPIFKSIETAALLQSAASGEQESFESEVVLNGHLTHLQIKLVPTTFDDGSIGATVIIEDITERRRTEKEIQQQRDFLNLVIESFDHPFYVIDANDYTIKMANKAARLGFLQDGSTCHVLTHRSSQPCSGDVHPCPLREVKATRKPVIVEHTHHHVSGMTRVQEVHGHPIFDEHGEVIQMIEYNLDVTERKQVEQELTRSLEMYVMLLSSVQDGILMMQNQRVVYCNEHLADMLGLLSKEVVGTDFKHFVTREDWSSTSKKIETLDTGKKAYGFHLLGKNRELIPVLAKFVSSEYLNKPSVIIIMKKGRSGKKTSATTKSTKKRKHT